MSFGIPTCEQAGCAGHLGKFQSCRDEALWQMSLDGGDETTGDVEYEGHVTLIVLEDEHVETIEDGPTVTIPAGSYLVEQGNSGAVYVTALYATEAGRAEAREIFRQVDERYSAWLDSDEDDV